MTNSESHDSLVSVVIHGQTYTVRAEEDASYIEELARFVDTKMESIAGATGSSDRAKIAILAALNIADEYFKLQKDLDRLDEELATRADELARALQETLREPTETSPAV